MDAGDDHASPAAALLAEDDGADVAAVVQAHINVLTSLRRRARANRIARRRRYCGSSVGRRGNKRRDFAAGLQRILRDYFGVGGEAPIYDERDFETRFRVPRAVFRRVYLAVKDEPFFQQRINATGRLQAHPLQKVVAAFRVIAYGEAADRADEYVRLSGTVIAQSTKLLMEFIVERWGSTYLRRPNQEELKTIMERNKERGMPGCMGSLDCCHWEWHQCPTGMAGAYQSRKGKRGIVIEAVCDEDLWVWHLFVGAPGSLNDINVMHQSPLYLDVTGGRWPPRNHPYTINGNTRHLPYYLVDGIYPRFSFLISPHPKPSTEEQTTFNRLQEALRKDVERLFGVLMKRFHVALHPGRYRSVAQLVTTFKAICILHNMCVERRRDSFVSRRRRAAGGDAGANSESGGDGGGSSGGGDGQSGGAPDDGTAAAGAPAPGGGSAVGGGGVAAAMADIDAAGNAPPACNPIHHPPAAGMAAVFDAWAETQNALESERLRDDLTADIYRDRGELLAPYIG